MDGLADGDDEILTGVAGVGDTLVAVGGDGEDEYDPGEPRGSPRTAPSGTRGMLTASATGMCS